MYPEWNLSLNQLKISDHDHRLRHIDRVHQLKDGTSGRFRTRKNRG
jgi:hypothetical protein